MYTVFNPRANLQAFYELNSLLTRHRQLTWEMARREISDRYLGQVLGIAWAIAHPLLMMAIYIFIFTVVFKVKLGGTREMPLDYPTYLMSGMISWLAFQEVLTKSSTVIINNANLVKQVVFPIEILAVKGVIAALGIHLIFILLLILYVMVTQLSLPLTYFLIPILLVLQYLAMTGMAYAISSISVYFRDVKDFVQAFNSLNFYLLPIIYLPEFVPEAFRSLLYFNPFSYMVWCYQDVFYFGRFEHVWAWPIFAAFSVGSFILGYRLFRKLKAAFGNVL